MHSSQNSQSPSIINLTRYRCTSFLFISQVYYYFGFNGYMDKQCCSLSMGVLEMAWNGFVLLLFFLTLRSALWQVTIDRSESD